MKTLYIVRHAKSSWKHDALTDFERPLNKRGHGDAPIMGGVLRERGAVVGLLRSSPANRALTTARMLAEALGFPLHNIDTDERMYGASDKQLLDIVRLFPDSIDNAMIVGHNPGSSMLAAMLGQFHESNLPTCGVVCIDFDLASWSGIQPGSGTTRYFEFPRDHK
jgi:phosphohistidine phosphatase